jgi:membrane associated rhomboid family serine protease
MSYEETLMLGIAGVAFVVSLVLSFFLGKHRNKLGLTIMGLVWAGGTGILVLLMYNATGWDTLGYLLFLHMVSAPAAVGGLIGGLVGLAKVDQAHASQTPQKVS